MLYRRWCSRILSREVWGIGYASRSGFLSNTKVYNVYHTRNLILNILRQAAWQRFSYELQVAKIHSKRKLGEMELACSGRIGKCPVSRV
jgi:hypothetical protein